MSEPAPMQGLAAAVQRYLDLMYDADLGRFDGVFRATARLHGWRNGVMTSWSAGEYKEVLAGRPSPKSLGAPREEEILLLDIAAADQALVKLRVRINAVVFLDYLLYHRVEGQWLITAKSFHVERVVPPGDA